MPIHNENITSMTGSINQPESLKSSVFNSGSFKGRDVLLINPFCNGQGDHALCNKIANIALDEGCRITISSVDAGDPTKINYRHLSLQNKEQHDISALNNPIFVVAPVGIFPVEELLNYINQLCEKYQFPKQDIALIEEMDLLSLPSQELTYYKTTLEKFGFENINTKQLGFGMGSIGYLPTEEHTINIIKQRFEGELIKLMDSYNVSLMKDSYYYLAYISSDLTIIAPQVFIANTLSETMSDDKDANYIIVLRQLNEHTKQELPKALKTILRTQNGKFDFPALFTKAKLFFADSNSGNLEGSIVITGQGKPNVNIVITQVLPNNIFEDFMCLSHSGMASGDQSFGEFLSLTGKMPYYDMQTWKYPLMEAIKDMGGKELEDIITQKIVGRMPFFGDTFYKLAPNRNQSERSSELLNKQIELDHKLSSHTATKHIHKLFSFNNNKNI